MNEFQRAYQELINVAHAELKQAQLEAFARFDKHKDQQRLRDELLTVSREYQGKIETRHD